MGCGTGTTDRHLAPRVRKLHGVDISEEMLVKAQHNVPKAKFAWYDGEKLPFADETFDVVVAICVLHHVPVSMRFKVVSEMVRVTRPEGIVAVFEHNPYNPLTRYAVNTCELDEDAVLLSSRETVGLLKDSADVEPEFRHFLFSPLGGAIGCSLDRHLRDVPLGGQYAAWAAALLVGSVSVLCWRGCVADGRASRAPASRLVDRSDSRSSRPPDESGRRSFLRDGSTPSGRPTMRPGWSDGAP